MRSVKNSPKMGCDSGTLSKKEFSAISEKIRDALSEVKEPKGSSGYQAECKKVIRVLSKSILALRHIEGVLERDLFSNSIKLSGSLLNSAISELQQVIRFLSAFRGRTPDASKMLHVELLANINKQSTGQYRWKRVGEQLTNANDPRLWAYKHAKRFRRMLTGNDELKNALRAGIRDLACRLIAEAQGRKPDQTSKEPNSLRSRAKATPK
jgi:hypothetical protein